MSSTPTSAYKGVFPVVPTTFTEDGDLDLASQLRCVDFMIDAGSDGLCILANFSEQFVLSDDEREVLTRAILEHVKGRVPVIVTTTHFSTYGIVADDGGGEEPDAIATLTDDPAGEHHAPTLELVGHVPANVPEPLMPRLPHRASGVAVADFGSALLPSPLLPPPRA